MPDSEYIIFRSAFALCLRESGWYNETEDSAPCSASKPYKSGSDETTVRYRRKG